MSKNLKIDLITVHSTSQNNSDFYTDWSKTSQCRKLPLTVAAPFEKTEMKEGKLEEKEVMKSRIQYI